MITTLYNAIYNKNFSYVIGCKFYKLSSIRKIYKSDTNFFNYDFILKNRLISGNFKMKEVLTNYKARFTKYGAEKYCHIFPADYKILKFKLLHNLL